MNRRELSALFEKMIKNECSKEEADRIVELFADPSNSDLLYTLVNQQLKGQPEDQTEALPSPTPHRKLSRSRALWYAAAAALFLLSAGIYLLVKINPPAPAPVVHQNTQVIKAGGNKAILTLSDGHQIDLDDMSNGEIATQANTVIKKKGNGVLEYNSRQKDHTLQGIPSPSFNTITIPKGGQYQVVLPDGSKVWLNAASSLKYPTQFDENERRVELTGEGYFEIAPISRQPFIVITNRQRIEVLGTMFNVNAYEDERYVRTTLLEGSVRVSVATGNDKVQTTPAKMLKPGQQSELVNNDLTVSAGNPEAALAWKNGMFQFENEDIGVVMRKIARWYDVEVEYHGNMQRKAFYGAISKYNNVNEVLKLLQKTEDVSFKIDDRKITVF